ncbi:hypothetical protein [Erythrobacter sp.]|uniref:hypothetical protein n=1 Tax=Erythrobacter sp. TaxID=1042 RepID=UPI0025E1C76A|nr:hypothetical protein [Erythrobacter sp.]
MIDTRKSSSPLIGSALRACEFAICWRMRKMPPDVPNLLKGDLRNKAVFLHRSNSACLAA